jgi:electron transfer flavoprotein beta subunit
MDPNLRFLSPEDRICRVNPYDEAALELALHLKDTHEEIEIVLLTIGDLIAEKELRRCFALGADELYQVEAGRNSHFKIRSRVIAETATLLGVDIVLCGKESLDRRNGQIPAFTAHMLGWPFLSSITELDLDLPKKQASVLRSREKGVRERITCSLPALFGTGLEKIDPRMPTHENFIKAESLTVRKLFFKELHDNMDAVPRKEFPPLPRAGKVSAPDCKLEAYQRIHLLLKGSSMEKKGRLIEGTPSEQVKEIINYLMKYGFIKRPSRNVGANTGE